MTDTPMIVIPADAAARIAETMQRKYDEALTAMQQRAAESIASGITSTEQKPTVIIRSASDASHCDVMIAVSDVFYGFYENEPQIDWQDFFDRLERYGYAVETTDSPAARKVQRYVRRLRAEQ